MRGRRRISKCYPWAATLVLAASLPAGAGQPTGSPDLSAAASGAPLQAESGKPAIGGPPAAPLGRTGTADCAPPLPCGTRLLGTIRKNGALELQVPALRW